MSKYVGGENLGEALHVALRKGCDSAPTSAAHICIGLMPDSLWGEYVKVVGYYLGRAKEKKVLTEKNAWEHLKFASTGETREPIDLGQIESTRRPGVMITKWDRYEPASDKWYDPGACFRADRERGVELITSLPKDELCFQAGGTTPDEVLQRRDRYRWLLKSILRSFSDDDWKGYACFLFQ